MAARPGKADARARSARRGVSESQLHRTVAEFLDWMLLPPTVWTTFPAGWTAMHKGAAGRLKGSGLKAGMPDILIFHEGGVLGIELKTEKGRATQVQLDLFKRLDLVGVRTHLCRSIEDVNNALIIENIPVRMGTIHGFNTKTKGRRPPQPDAGAAAT